MNFFRYRRLQRDARHLLHAAKVARATREDVAEASDLARLDKAMQGIEAAVAARDEARFNEAAQVLHAETVRIHPAPALPHLHEWVEIAVVAIGVAMTFRCYVLQPFKIPTGSMMPTLYGVTAQAQDAPGWQDRFPVNLVGWALFGEGYVHVRSKVSGTVEIVEGRERDRIAVVVNGVAHRVRSPLKEFIKVQNGQFVERGQTLVQGRLKFGDQVFVNRMRYNFIAPHRGDVIVFDTSAIEHPQIQPGDFYIKRLVGLPGERIMLDPPYLVADGRKVLKPEFFRRKAEEWNDRFQGYVFAQPSWPIPKLGRAGEELALAPDQFLPMGDNTRSSLDGRYFGGVPIRSLVGPASMVYWPISERWGFLK